MSKQPSYSPDTDPSEECFFCQAQGYNQEGHNDETEDYHRIIHPAGHKNVVEKDGKGP